MVLGLTGKSFSDYTTLRIRSRQTLLRNMEIGFWADEKQRVVQYGLSCFENYAIAIDLKLVM